jgi:hypothetical protein
MGVLFVLIFINTVRFYFSKIFYMNLNIINKIMIIFDKKFNYEENILAICWNNPVGFDVKCSVI